MIWDHMVQLIGLREKLQENYIFPGKIGKVSCRFSLSLQPIEEFPKTIHQQCRLAGYPLVIYPEENHMKTPQENGEVNPLVMIVTVCELENMDMSS